MSDAAERVGGMATPTCVIDTNVALDLWLFEQPSVAGLTAALAKGSIQALATVAMRAELLHVLQRGSLAGHWLERRSASDVLTAWDGHVAIAATDRPVPGPRPLCTDPDDQIFIDLALATHATWLFTRDRAVLKLGRQLRPFGLTVGAPEDWFSMSASYKDRCMI